MTIRDKNILVVKVIKLPVIALPGCRPRLHRRLAGAQSSVFCPATYLYRLDAYILCPPPSKRGLLRHANPALHLFRHNLHRDQIHHGATNQVLRLPRRPFDGTSASANLHRRSSPDRAGREDLAEARRTLRPRERAGSAPPGAQPPGQQQQQEAQGQYKSSNPPTL